jgi:hypothetical protein
MARLALHPRVAGAVDVAPWYRMQEIEVTPGCPGASRPLPTSPARRSSPRSAGPTESSCYPDTRFVVRLKRGSGSDAVRELLQDCCQRHLFVRRRHDAMCCEPKRLKISLDPTALLRVIDVRSRSGVENVVDRCISVRWRLLSDGVEPLQSPADIGLTLSGHRTGPGPRESQPSAGVFAAAPLPSSGMEATKAVISRKRIAELGRLLARAEGYEVLTSMGRRLGRVEHVRYQQYADRPDEIVVRSRGLLRTRRRAYPLSAVHEVKPRERTVILDPAGDGDPTTGGAKVVDGGSRV